MTEENVVIAWRRGKDRSVAVADGEHLGALVREQAWNAGTGKLDWIWHCDAALRCRCGANWAERTRAAAERLAEQAWSEKTREYRVTPLRERGGGAPAEAAEQTVRAVNARAAAQALDTAGEALYYFDAVESLAPEDALFAVTRGEQSWKIRIAA